MRKHKQYNLSDGFQASRPPKGHGPTGVVFRLTMTPGWWDKNERTFWVDTHKTYTVGIHADTFKQADANLWKIHKSMMRLIVCRHLLRGVPKEIAKLWKEQANAPK